MAIEMGISGIRNQIYLSQKWRLKKKVLKLHQKGISVQEYPFDHSLAQKQALFKKKILGPLLM